jgi:hypothetical protein
MLALFRYGSPPVWYQRMMWVCGLVAVAMWLYFTVIHMQLIDRMREGQTDLFDALIGFPLVLALTVVIYASVLWVLKWALIFVAPHVLTMPPDDSSHFELDANDHQSQ